MGPFCSQNMLPKNISRRGEQTKIVSTGRLRVSNTIFVDLVDYLTKKKLLSCQPRVTVTSCVVYKVIRDLDSIAHLCINPIHRVGLIHK